MPIKVISSSGASGALGPNKTGYGEQSVAENLPVIQAYPVYNFLPSNFRAFTATGGTAGVESKMFKVSTGTSVGGYGAVQSFRTLNYKPGESNMARFSALFESSAASSWQGVGFLNLGDEMSFGYNGTDFGVWHRYGGLAEVRVVTVTGAAGGSENLTLTLNGVGYTIPLTTGTVNHNAYEIADWLDTNQSVWYADQVDDTVILVALSDGAKAGAYTFSSSTATGSIAQTTAGVTKTSDFVAQSAWNGEDASWLDPTKGNVYEIQYQYLGFGAIKYYIESPTTGEFLLVHAIRFANANTTPSLGNPSMRLGMYCVSTGSTTDLIVRSGSMAGFTQGLRARTRNPRATENTQSVTTTFTNVLAVRNRKSYNGYVNQVEVDPLLLTLANDSTKDVEVEVRATTDPGIELDYSAVGTNLVIDKATNTGEVTVGRPLGAFTISGGGSGTVDLEKLKIRLPPTLHFIVQARVTGGSASNVTAALTWYEDV